MSKLRIMIASIATLFVIVFGFFVWSGGFFTPVISEVSEGPMIFIGIAHKGPYENISPKFKESSEKANSLNIETEPMAGIYFDDPSMELAENLRSYAGFITTQANSEKLQAKFPEFRTILIPKQIVLKAEFPNKGFVSMILAIKKIYPKFGEYFAEKKIVMPKSDRDSEKNYAMEIYNKDNIEIFMTIPK